MVVLDGIRVHVEVAFCRCHLAPIEIAEAIVPLTAEK